MQEVVKLYCSGKKVYVMAGCTHQILNSNLEAYLCTMLRDLARCIS